MQRVPEKSIFLILPMPITVNKAYTGMQKRVKSSDYKVWEAKAILALRKQKKYSIYGDKWLSCIYTFYTSLVTAKWEKRIWDVANREKVLSDLLAKHGIEWFQDHKIKEMKLIKEEKHDTEERVEVLIWEL